MRKPATVQPRPLWALICLLTFLLSATPLLPITMAFIAWADGEHQVTLAIEKDGMRIVLGHDAHNARTALTHSHCVVSRALTLLAEPSGPVHSDHVLNFHGSNLSALSRGKSSIAVPLSAGGTALQTLTPTSITRTTAADVEAPLLDIPPPAMSVVIARTTVLVI